MNNICSFSKPKCFLGTHVATNIFLRSRLFDKRFLEIQGKHHVNSPKLISKLNEMARNICIFYIHVQSS